ncbi:MAG: hypothetical protein WDW38_004039 [Sanguina aurantia]
MADVEIKDKKKSKSSSDGAEKKEKKEKKEKESSKDSKTEGGEKVSKEKKEKREKDPDAAAAPKADKADKEKRDKSEKSEKPPKDKSDKVSKDKKSSRDDAASAADTGRPGAPPPPTARAPPVKSMLPAKKTNYLAGLDLPSEEEEEEEYERGGRGNDSDDDKKPVLVAASGRETKKLADKERQLAEKAFRAKEDALREDDNVFDVSFEGQGEIMTTVSATDVKVHNLTIRAKGKVLLEGTSLTIAAGRRYGLVGPNGRGKSTLLRMMAKRQIPVPENIDVLLVEQEVVGDDSTALEAVVAADVELMELRAELAILEAQLSAEPEPVAAAAVQLKAMGLKGSAPQPAPAAEPFDHDAALERQNEIYERLNNIGGSSAESRASKILHGLGFTPIMQKRATTSFSGGWRMRISLARALYIQPTLLLLDEPTNHLDLRAVLWLEEYLQRWKKTLVVVSHDRDFLNTITTDIIHLHDLKLHMYKGNFAQFEEMYEQKRREVNKAYDKFEKQLKAAKQSGKSSKLNQEKVKDSAMRAQARRVKSSYGTEDDSSAAAADQPQKWSDYTVEFHFPEPTELAPPLIQLIEVDFKYPSRDDFGLQGVNLGIDMGSRIAIVGPNGAGKTTLMNLLSGDLEPTEGESRRSHKLRIGRYAQHFVDALSFDVNPVEYLLAKFPTCGVKPEGMRQLLGRFGLGGAHHLTPICKLSGGQKNGCTPFLVPAEPSLTHPIQPFKLDASRIQAQGTVSGIIVISHDAQLLARLCADQERSQVLIVDDGTITKYEGDFEDYRNELTKEIAADLDEDD